MFAYQLAVMLGHVNVDEMLRSITAKQFMEWEAYSQLAPFPHFRSDYNAASIVKALWDIARDRTRHPNPFSLDDVVVRYGMDAEPKKTAEGMKDHGRIFRAIAEAYNSWVK